MAGSGHLTTHVLDTMHGRPGAGIRVELFRLREAGRETLATIRTNLDGRADEPLLAGEQFRPGTYELHFHVGEYFAHAGVDLPDLPFLDVVPVGFGIASADQHYLVPLLISPYGYSTYRGS